MNKLTLGSIGTFDQYQLQRPAIRQAMIAHKKNRRVQLGPNATLHFEDTMTMRYQVQEMMRAEQLRDAAAITGEIEAYNPLIPDGSNLKCTLMLEFPVAAERRVQLHLLRNVEHQVYVQVAGFDPVSPIADEDLQRSAADKTSAVHFLRYEFSADMIRAAKEGATWIIFSDHPAYRYRLEPVPDHITRALCRDFD